MRRAYTNSISNKELPWAIMVLVSLTVAILLFGCSRDEESSSSAASPETAQATSSVAPPSAAMPAASTQPAVPVASDANAAISEAEAALKAKQYELAAKTLLSVQTRQLTEQQSQAAHRQMVDLQRDLAAAIARGDAQAKAAAELLRRSASGAR